MGTLYYFRKDSGESFALNKAYRYFTNIPLQDWERHSLADLAADPEDFKRRYLSELVEKDPEWTDRIVQRIYAWAQPEDALRLAIDCGDPDDVPDEKDITGSPYDDDYDADGTYIPGSAW